jgi:hypothetical protein
MTALHQDNHALIEYRSDLRIPMGSYHQHPSAMGNHGSNTKLRLILETAVIFILFPVSAKLVVIGPALLTND